MSDEVEMFEWAGKKHVVVAIPRFVQLLVAGGDLLGLDDNGEIWLAIDQWHDAYAKRRVWLRMDGVGAR